MCNKPISERTVFIVRLESGEQKRACCAHCGLMIQSQAKDAMQSLTADYLHGHIISADQAVYILGSESDNLLCAKRAQFWVTAGCGEISKRLRRDNGEYRGSN